MYTAVHASPAVRGSCVGTPARASHCERGRVAVPPSSKSSHAAFTTFATEPCSLLIQEAALPTTLRRIHLYNGHEGEERAHSRRGGGRHGV